LLKEGDKIPVQNILSEINEKRKVILEPKTIILETRIKQLRNRAITKYLIKWKNLPVEKVTWEDEFFLQKHLQLIKC
jgi:hypothetical protein